MVETEVDLRLTPNAAWSEENTCVTEAGVISAVMWRAGLVSLQATHPSTHPREGTAESACYLSVLYAKYIYTFAAKTAAANGMDRVSISSSSNSNSASNSINNNRVVP